MVDGNGNVHGTATAAIGHSRDDQGSDRQESVEKAQGQAKAQAYGLTKQRNSVATAPFARQSAAVCGVSAKERGMAVDKNQEVDPDRTEGSATNLGGKVKEGAGKLLGDEKLKNEGRVDQVKGKVQNALGSVKDALKGK
jgi:uncharacterized protein YjbJ (UPF0337 family)